MSITCQGALYQTLATGSIENAIATHFASGSRSLVQELAAKGATVEGFRSWIDANGFSPYQIEEVGENENPKFRHDHPILSPSQGKWLFGMQERGSGYLIQTYSSRTEALQDIATEVWQFFVIALEARDRVASRLQLRGHAPASRVMPLISNVGDQGVALLAAQAPRVKAGEPVPTSGLWQAVDVGTHQRQAKAGDKLPDLGSSYGTTVWQLVSA